MPIIKRVFRGSLLITLGEFLSQACSLVRNIILARTLTQSDFGVAAILGMTISIFEIGGRLSVEYCLVQAKDGDQPRFMAVAHLLQVSLGIFSAVLILVAAIPITNLFNVPDAAWAVRVLAAIPFIRSISHLDTHRMQRNMRFGPSVLIDVVPQIAMTLAVWPLARVWGSYSILVWLFLGKQTASTLLSHFVAERTYRWSYDIIIIRSLLKFGWPMLINGFLLFGIMQGDRFAVGLGYTVAELGVYAIAGSLSLLPAATLLKLSGSIFLPILAGARDYSFEFRRRVVQSARVLGLFSGIYAVVMIVAGLPLVSLIFGPNYESAGALVAWLGLGQAFRLLRNLPTVAAMAKGDTKNLMYSNLLRLTSLGLAFLVAYSGGSLAAIAACAATGEGIALVGSLYRFSRGFQTPASTYMPSFIPAGVVIVISGILSWYGVPELPILFCLSIVAFVIIGFVGIHLFMFRESRDLISLKLLPWISARFSSIA